MIFRISQRSLQVDLVVLSTTPGGEASERRQTDAVGLSATRQACSPSKRVRRAVRPQASRRLRVQEQFFPPTPTPRVPVYDTPGSRFLNETPLGSYIVVYTVHLQLAFSSRLCVG